jgi:WD40 repeat protein
MAEFYNAFISYGRADSQEFAIKLYNCLTKAGFNIWFDHNDIPLAVDFQNQIDDGIAKADNFLFIISPHGVNSPYCQKEINLALKYHKRIIPLLHVEQITQEIWQARNPQGTEAEWQDYQAKGLHSSFTNMPPEIAKINWVYFRENIDNFETSCAGLIQVFQHHADYVSQHTELLVKALEWARGKKQSSYLLIGEAKQGAERWLQVRFKHEQPPCLPTDLHCEYICESIKNSNNLMTHVFLCYAEANQEIMEKITRSLRREKLTVWTKITDMETGIDVREQIHRGIAAADNFVYLICPESLRSKSCQGEIKLALAYHKRIICVIVDRTDEQMIPLDLKNLPLLNLTPREKKENYGLVMAQLVKQLKTDENYYQQHKILLVKALKWQEQKYNPSILLRGYNLQHFQAWLKVAKTRQQHPPIPLQVKFIEESLRQPTIFYLEVFISYSRVDSDFARKINDALQLQGKTTWFDQESIASGSNFQQEIYRGIEQSDNFLFIISPSSVNSPYCGDEVEYAKKLNKRLVTILYRPVAAGDLHPILAQVQWIDFSQHGGDFYANFSELIRTLDTDREYVHSHSQLLQRAIAWYQKKQNPDLLLRGSELAIAENWLTAAQRMQKQPPVSKLHQAFISKSRQQEHLEAERWKQLYIQAEKQRIRAEVAEIKALNSLSKAYFLSHQQLKGLFAIIQAGFKLKNTRVSDLIRLQTISFLHTSIYQIQEQNCFNRHDQEVASICFSPDGELLASASADRNIKIWRKDGQLLSTLTGHTDRVCKVIFHPQENERQILISGGQDGLIKFWTVDGELLQTIEGHKNGVFGLAFSPNGQILASVGGDKKIKLWQSDGTWIRTISGHGDRVVDVTFSPDGQKLATASYDATVRLWDLNSRNMQVFPGHFGEVLSVAFSPDGKILASAGRDKTIILWNTDGIEQFSLKGHDAQVFNVTFSADGQIIASASADGTVKLWSRKGKELQTFFGHQGAVFQVKFSPVSFDGEMLASGSADGTVKLWRRNARVMPWLQLPVNQITQVSFSRDRQLFATATSEGWMQLWNLAGIEQQSFPGSLETLRQICISPKGDAIASAGENGVIKLWDLQGKQTQPIFGHETTVVDLAFSPDGEKLVSVGADGTLKLWQVSYIYAKISKTLKISDRSILRVQFSPNGQNIVAANTEGNLYLLDANGGLLNSFSAHNHQIWALGFSPDSQMIVSGSEDKTIKLWNLDGKIQQVFSGHGDRIVDICFSPDGKILVSGSEDDTVRIWSLDGKFMQVLSGHQTSIIGIGFSQDGKTLISVSSDGMVKFWNFDLDDLLTKGCDWLRDYLNTNPEVDETDRHLGIS